MLTEEQREILINSFKQNVSFVYKEWNIDPKIFRFGEGFDKKHPYITVDFIPTSRMKFRSVSNVIGNATPKGEYKEYGFCQLEQCVIRAYAHVSHKNRTISGRIIADFMMRQCLIYVMRFWNGLLHGMNYACLDLFEDLLPRDVSVYEPGKGVFIYIYEASFFIRTQFRWNYIPEDYTGETIVEKIGMYYKETNEDNFNYEHIKIESD